MCFFKRKEGRNHTLYTIPNKSDVIDGLFYDTTKAELIAYSLKNSWENYNSYDYSPYWGVDFKALYRTKNGRYFKHRYDDHLLLFNDIYSLDENEAMKLYHDCDEKVVSLELKEA